MEEIDISGNNSCEGYFVAVGAVLATKAALSIELSVVPVVVDVLSH